MLYNFDNAKGLRGGHGLTDDKAEQIVEQFRENKPPYQTIVFPKQYAARLVSSAGNVGARIKQVIK